MAYDEELAERVRAVLSEQALTDLEEKRMFGGLAWLLGGKLLCGVMDDAAMLRVGAELYDEQLERPGVRPLGAPGKPKRGYVLVDRRHLTTDDLRVSIQRALTLIGALDKSSKRSAHSPRRKKS